MTTYLFDTNAGPIFRTEKPSASAMRQNVERQMPMIRKRNYTWVWTRFGPWHVLTISNSKGKKAHACAFRPMSRAEVDAWPGQP